MMVCVFSCWLTCLDNLHNLAVKSFTIFSLGLSFSFLISSCSFSWLSLLLDIHLIDLNFVSCFLLLPVPPPPSSFPDMPFPLLLFKILMSIDPATLTEHHILPVYYCHKLMAVCLWAYYSHLSSIPLVYLSVFAVSLDKWECSRTYDSLFMTENDKLWLLLISFARINSSVNLSWNQLLICLLKFCYTLVLDFINSVHFYFLPFWNLTFCSFTNFSR